MEHTKEFLVYEVTNTADSLIIDGIVNKGDIRVGDALKIPNSSDTVTILEIHAYQHKLDTLCQGVSVRLITTLGSWPTTDDKNLVKVMVTGP